MESNRVILLLLKRLYKKYYIFLCLIAETYCQESF